MPDADRTRKESLGPPLIDSQSILRYLQRPECVARVPSPARPLAGEG